MLADPVEGFLSGIESFWVRLFYGGLAIFAGFMVCAPIDVWDLEVLQVWMFMTFGSVLWWGAFGAWFLVGIISLGLMLTFLWTFIYDFRPKFSLFATFSVASLYYSPLAFSEDRWLAPLCIYAAAVFCYWVVPHLLARWIARRQGY